MSLRYLHNPTAPKASNPEDQRVMELMHTEGRKLFNACALMILIEHVRAHLEKTDPMALRQLTEALGGNDAVRRLTDIHRP